MKSGTVTVQAEPRNGHADGLALRRTFVVDIPHGLHARPCALLVKTLQPYKCRIEIRAGREVANGQSIIGLMALAAGTGSEVSFTISGEDAARAMAAVSRVFEDRFGERHGSSGDSDECSQRRSGDSEARC